MDYLWSSAVVTIKTLRVKFNSIIRMWEMWYASRLANNLVYRPMRESERRIYTYRGALADDRLPDQPIYLIIDNLDIKLGVSRASHG